MNGHAGHSSLSHTTRWTAVATKIRKTCELREPAEGICDILAGRGVRVEMNVSFFSFTLFSKQKDSREQKKGCGLH